MRHLIIATGFAVFAPIASAVLVVQLRSTPAGEKPTAAHPSPKAIDYAATDRRLPFKKTFFTANLRETSYQQDIRLMGTLIGSDANPAVYFSIRVGDDDKPLPDNLPFRFSYRGETYTLASLSPDDVQKMGGTLSNPDYGVERARIIHGYLGWGTQNRDGDVEFDFRDDKLAKFYARWILIDPSPFAFIFHDDERITFPFDHGQLVRAFGEPATMNDSWVK